MRLSTFSSDFMRRVMRERMLVILALALVLTISVGFIFKNTRSLATDPVADRFWVLKIFFRRPGYNIVLVGDSRMYRGLSPECMGKLLPDAKIINFGFSNSSLSRFMLEKAQALLDSEARNRIIVLGITPHSLTSRAAEDEHYRSIAKMSFAEAFERAYFVPLRMFFRPISKKDIRIALGKAKVRANRYHELFSDDGWVASWYDVAQPTSTLAGYRATFSSSKVSAELCRDVFQTVREWKTRGIQTYAFRVPTTVEMVSLEDAVSGFREKWFVEEFRHAGGIWLEVKGHNYLSYDGSHLDAESARALSREIARRIREAIVPLKEK